MPPAASTNRSLTGEPDDSDHRPPLGPMLRRILGYARPHAGRLAAALLLSVLGSLIVLVVPLGLRALLDAVFQGGDRGLLDRLALALLGLFVARTGIGFLGSYWMAWVGERIIADLRQAIYAHLHRLGLKFYTDSRTGEITSRLTNDVGSLRSAATTDLSQLLSQGITLLGSVGLMLILNWRLSIVVFATVPIVVLLSRYFGHVVRRYARQIQDRLAETTAIAEEALTGVRVVKAFAREDYETGRYHNAVEDLFGTAKRQAILTSAFWALVGLLFMGVLVGIFWYGGVEVLAGRLTAGDLVAFIFYAFSIAQSVGGLSRLYTSYSSAAGASERVFEILDTEPEIEDAPDARALPPVRGRVAFEDVTFGYEAGQPILRDVSFEVAPGETVALVGPSGAGKTTLVGLLPRFYDPDAGSVRVDGYDLRTVRLHDLRSQIGLVSQEVQLFGTSIAENIRYGRLDATDDEVRAAAEAANALGFIDALPDGLATPVGERGVKLSGGQRQRVAIARALLKDPRILLLDEATSALDAESEALVQEALDRLLEGRTAFVIAHRLATVRDADRILVLEDGRIVERGTHAELSAQGGLYRRLADLQFRDPAPTPAPTG